MGSGQLAVGGGQLAVSGELEVGSRYSVAGSIASREIRAKIAGSERSAGEAEVGREPASAFS